MFLWTLFMAGCGGDDHNDSTATPPGDAASDSAQDGTIKQDAAGGTEGSAQREAGDETTHMEGATPDAPSDSSKAEAETGATDAPAEANQQPDVVGEAAVDAGSDVTTTADVTTTDDAGDTTITADAAQDGATTDTSTSPDATIDASSGQDAPGEAGAATLTSISVTPVNPAIAKGTTVPFSATGTYSDNSTKDLTGAVTWSSTDTGVATIDNSGIGAGVAVGQTTITATLGSVNGTTLLSVTAAVLSLIEVTPTNPSIADGTAKQFIATGTFSDNSTQDITASVTWSSDTTGVATVDDGASKGLAAAQSPGQAKITATSGAISGSTNLTVTAATLVSISVTPTNPTIANNTAKQLKATGFYTDGSTQDLTAQATFSSSDETVATVSNTAGTVGLVSAVAPGQTTIKAAFGGKEGSTLLTVSNATLSSIAVNPSSPSAAKGLPQQFVAIGTFSDNSTQDITATVTWDSSDPTIASISNDATTHGLATTLTTGDTTIKATQSAVSGTTTLHVSAAILESITVSPSAQSIANGTTLPFVATGIFSDTSTQDLTTSVTWGSSAGAVASISNANGSKGLATGSSPGDTTISATSGGITGSTKLTVTPATLASITVTPANPSIAKGTSVHFVATGIYTDSSTQDLTASVTWDSTDPSVSSISNSAGTQGFASALATGTTTITATQGSTSGQTILTVTAATLSSIAVTPTNPSIAKGTSKQFIATGTYSDNSTQDLTTSATWGSTAAAVASISNSAGSEGKASALSPGQTTITATIGNVSGSTSLTVTPATLVSISVTPTNPSIAKGTTVQFTAIGTYTDNTTQNLTASVAWGSSSGTVANVSNGGGSQGLTTALAPGQTTISATSGAVAGTTTLTVTAAVLQTISVTPVNPTIAKGTTKQFVATGTYSDGTTQDLTAAATWNSTAPSVAIVDNTNANKGLATGTGVGSASVSASVGAVNGSTTLTVTAATLVSIVVTPAAPSVANGTTVQFTATGTYSDATMQDITAQVVWASDHNNVVVISNAPSSKGFATAVGVGTATISAKRSGVTGTTDVTVTAATLDSIVVTPDPVTLAKGTAQAYKATGNYSDGSSQDITTQVSWSSTDPTVAAISNSTGTEGLATGVGAGSVTVKATLGNVVGSASLTVTNAVLQSITVTPANRTVAQSTTVQYSAVGHFSDSTDQTITAQVSWSSTKVSVAIISNSQGSQGLATTVGAGSTSIRATLSGVTGSTNLTVTGP